MFLNPGRGALPNLVSASSNAEELGEEKLSAQFFNERIISMTVCRDLNNKI